MSGAASEQTSTATTKAVTDDSTSTPQDLPSKQHHLEEDDEFEDFPVEDWGDEDTDLANVNDAADATSEPKKGSEVNTHLWEESWDDDEEATEDFAVMLREELKKVEASGGDKR